MYDLYVLHTTKLLCKKIHAIPHKPLNKRQILLWGVIKIEIISCSSIGSVMD